MDNSDYIAVSANERAGTVNATFTNADATDSDGDGNAANDATSVGESIEVNNLTGSDTLTVVGSLDGKQAVLQTYTVKA
jgi:hypothetical protein